MTYFNRNKSLSGKRKKRLRNKRKKENNNSEINISDDEEMSDNEKKRFQSIKEKKNKNSKKKEKTYSNFPIAGSIRIYLTKYRPKKLIKSIIYKKIFNNIFSKECNVEGNYIKIIPISFEEKNELSIHPYFNNSEVITNLIKRIGIFKQKISLTPNKVRLLSMIFEIYSPDIIITEIEIYLWYTNSEKRKEIAKNLLFPYGKILSKILKSKGYNKKITLPYAVKIILESIKVKNNISFDRKEDKEVFQILSNVWNSYQEEKIKELSINKPVSVIREEIAKYIDSVYDESIIFYNNIHHIYNSL